MKILYSEVSNLYFHYFTLTYNKKICLEVAEKNLMMMSYKCIYFFKVTSFMQRGGRKLKD